MSNRIYTVKMDDGSVWGVPAEIIADNRAKYYQDKDPDTTYQEEFDLMIEWFDAGDCEFADWAQNNMNWADVKDSATLIANGADADYQEGWVNGEFGYATMDKEATHEND